MGNRKPKKPKSEVPRWTKRYYEVKINENPSEVKVIEAIKEAQNIFADYDKV